MFAALHNRVLHLGRTPRLCLAGGCLLLALVSALGAHRSAAASREVAVVVAARNLPAGHVLSRADLTVARWPARLRPVGARASPEPVTGRRLAGPIRAREPITPARLAGHGLTTGLDAAMVAIPVPLDDAQVADLVHAGDRVDVLETPRRTGFEAGPASAAGSGQAASAPAQVAAHGVLVLAVLPGTDTADSELVIAADRATALRLTGDRPSKMFTVIADPS